MNKQLSVIIGILVLTLCMSSAAQAVPKLQIYIEGATYDDILETWVIDWADTDGGTFELWVIGETVKDGGEILDVKLSASMIGVGGTVDITPLGGLSVTDMGSDETQFLAGGANYSPAFAHPVSTHEEYASAGAHHFWGLGDFTGTSDAIGDYQGGVPTVEDQLGQINRYSVTVTGWYSVHFDAFDHVVMTTTDPEEDGWNYKFVPPSHDATAIPEPGTIALLGMGLLGLGQRLRNRRRS